MDMETTTATTATPEFAEYVLSFYGHDGINVEMFDNDPMTRLEVDISVQKLATLDIFTASERESFDRELVRDMALCLRGSNRDLEHSHFIRTIVA